LIVLVLAIIGATAVLAVLAMWLMHDGPGGRPRNDTIVFTGSSETSWSRRRGWKSTPKKKRRRDMATQSKTYTCPMHLEVKQDSPGNCPKCGMKLVPASGKSRHESMPQHGRMPDGAHPGPPS
jgi:hypothetical protein